MSVCHDGRREYMGGFSVLGPSRRSSRTQRGRVLVLVVTQREILAWKVTVKGEASQLGRIKLV